MLTFLDMKLMSLHKGSTKLKLLRVEICQIRGRKNIFLQKTRSQRSGGVRSSPLNMFYPRVCIFDFLWKNKILFFFAGKFLLEKKIVKISEFSDSEKSPKFWSDFFSNIFFSVKKNRKFIFHKKIKKYTL